jgi:hypothetical protein
MQETVRTTIRIRKDLFDKSRLLAVKKSTSLQEVINNTLALGLGKVSDLESSTEAMMKIDKLRLSLSAKNINLEDLLNKSKSDLK